jgi:tight adherence protein C
MMDGSIPLEIVGLIALTLAAAATTVWSYFNARPSEIRARLSALRHTTKDAGPLLVISGDTPKRLWERTLIFLGSSQEAGRKKNRRDSLRRLLRHAGFNGITAVQIVLGIRAVLMLGLPALAAPMLLANGEDRMPAVIFLLGVLSGLGFVLPVFIVGRLATRRRSRINASLPSMLDLLVLCVESGLSLDAAIARVADDRGSAQDPLAKELAHLSSELRVGVARREALRNLAERTGSEEVRGLVAHLVQADRLGGSLGPALRAQAETVRTTRKLRAEEIANRMPVKMLLPTALFLPPLLIVIFVPVVLQAKELLSGG